MKIDRLFELNGILYTKYKAGIEDYVVGSYRGTPAIRVRTDIRVDNDFNYYVDCFLKYKWVLGVNTCYYKNAPEISYISLIIAQ